jgi:hypothetical protein
MDTDRLLDPVVKAALKAMNDGDRATCTLGRLQDLLEIRKSRRQGRATQRRTARVGTSIGRSAARSPVAP